MRRLVIPEVYTIVSFAVAIGLWAVFPRVTLVETEPLYLTHPFFMVELFTMASTVAIWLIAGVLFIDSLRTRNIRVVDGFAQNGLLTLLALFTITVAAVGSLVYSAAPGPNPTTFQDSLVGIVSLSEPNTLIAFNSFGIILCEVVWILLGWTQLRTRTE